MSATLPQEADRVASAPHPRTTATVFGQDAAIAEYLAATRARRPPLAWLITGPRGTGKATLAWAIARHLLVGDPNAGLDIDATHPVFRRMAALTHASLHLCRRQWDPKTERLRTDITVDEVRAILAFFRLSASDGGARVTIVDAADDMNVSASNALLKLLEEPPEHSTFLLVSHRPARLLPTIRSRCRILRCRPLASEDVAKAMVASGADPAEEVRALTSLAEGSMGSAWQLASEGGLALYGEICALLAHAPPIDREAMLALASSVTGRTSGARYDMLAALLETAATRLARAASGAELAPVSKDEARAFARLACGARHGRLWAETARVMGERHDHARTVHLDPVQIIVDMLLQIDGAAFDAASVPA